ncbi:hypothetical protein M885DRAFT_508466 [Pelagophyceae sp. CCMP2097]|nr:hypothetical protein M885DRAFT_508466 [Pelagophyceae sp. CCMP2097]
MADDDADMARIRRRAEAFDEEGSESDESDVDDDEIQRRANAQLEGGASDDDGDDDDDNDDGSVEEVTKAAQAPRAGKARATSAALSLGERLAQRRSAVADPANGAINHLKRTYDGEHKVIPTRADKNQPQEVSNKRPNWRAGPSAPKPKVRDPRFDDQSGELSHASFQKRYDWLDDHEKTEIDRESKRLKRDKRSKVTNADARQELEKSKQRRHERKRAERKADIISSAAADDRQKVKATGKQPFYIKQAELKQRVLADQFAELQKSGKLNKFLARKARKEKRTDSKAVPERRPRGAAAS